ncbi:hypothetical protein SLEP1_g23951 [Rubroshorea leprosula]|uniref:C2H2-type domain-containing protein n=1 Tax=Rubroshorea leprosula TaxID=152421 RepID=A0AAV5JJ94_9ROSI|nr:hypothetical protein SLEP1_g23951 [Rubroshorea leprosula]
MERHKCRLCFKSFANGRALGGHMRSHMLNLPVPPKLPEESPVQLSEEAESAPSSSSSEEDEEEEEEKGQFYGLRENPKRSIRLVDPEFSLPVDAGSVILQDRESETESSRNPTRRRSKRNWKQDHEYHHRQQSQEHENTKKLKFSQLNKAESWAAEPEPLSSISDATNEEDVAFCLMMLSRDKWKKNEQKQKEPEQETEQEQEEETEETDDSDDSKLYKNNRSRGKYKCETCNRVFKSYQALGGHRASHKKIKLLNPSPAREPEMDPENVGTSSVADKKIHECPVCFRVFSSGQALGGHKRSHVTGLVATPAKSTTSMKFGENSFIDLNLPAPIEDDDYSQIELSAVSDAEFVNHVRR